MALVLNDRVKETSTTQGTGDITLAGASTGFISFNTGIGTSNTTYYCIFEQGTNNFEIGLGTLSASTTLQRTTVIKNSAGNTSKIDFNTGGSSTLDVFCTFPASKTMDMTLTTGGDIFICFSRKYSSSFRKRIRTSNITNEFRGDSSRMGDSINRSN